MLAFSNPLSILNGSIGSTTTYDKIVRDQLVDAVTTNQGERVMHPTWGCNIQGMLYDPSSSLERNDAASYIQELLIHMVPRALILAVTVGVSAEEPNTVYIDISYKASTFSPASSVSIALDTTTTNPAAGVGA
jgi:phage baseplate assembly protein W